ncbi:NAD(P)H-flavin reductase [Catenovulum maritimum]|uniref:FAD-binding FR-type domain-containing protein n=1 Tax=Catenovulum maritimum TaxID=1513271 RepID=A0A0J8GT46_9ALTE|nr:NAD(P)H-flavin reductase [Catenovulum maritimum]KMT65960.1 hypothetical protein XM47_05750 [Catenovulum maritimum]
MPVINCEVIEIAQLTEFVAKVILKPSEPFEFIAGQYIEVILNENDARPFSIANSPIEKGIIELHIGSAVGDDYTSAALDFLKNNQQVQLKGPSGNAGLQANFDKPTILLAGGTGFSYIKSIADTMLATNLTSPVYFYWGLRNEDAAYQLEEWQAKQTEQFHFIPVIENPTADWKGRNGNVIDAVLADFPNLAEYNVYSAGRFEMVGKARDEFTRVGLDKANMFADAFAFI